MHWIPSKCYETNWMVSKAIPVTCEVKLQGKWGQLPINNKTTRAAVPEDRTTNRITPSASFMMIIVLRIYTAIAIAFHKIVHSVEGRSTGTRNVERRKYQLCPNFGWIPCNRTKPIVLDLNGNVVLSGNRFKIVSRKAKEMGFSGGLTFFLGYFGVPPS